MRIAEVVLVGDGFILHETPSHPAGRLFSGGYDRDLNKLFLASVVGHPGGVAAAGGDPSRECIAGMRVLCSNEGNVYWMLDSMSLPQSLDKANQEAVQCGLVEHFHDQSVTQVENLEAIPRG